MKRMTAAAVAAATAMSLATVPAIAQEGSADTGTGKSSEIENEDALDYARDNADKATGLAKNALGKETQEERDKALNPLASSLKSDKANNWAPGKTADILLGTGITAAILGLIAFFANSGGGLNLKLPF